MDKNSINYFANLKNRLSLQNNFLFVLALLISLSFIRCANMQTPTGGPKDSIPPVILNELPANLTRNFKQKEIVLTFDEYIKLNNQHKEFSISPDLDKQPEYRVKKSDPSRNPPDPLGAHPPSTICCSTRVVDYTESNPIVNYNYGLSTGPQLHARSSAGCIAYASTHPLEPRQD